jgi:choline kinase
MRIIILAAGKGERLMPLTRNTPKPLLDLGNGATLLEEQIASTHEAGGIDEIVLVLGYLAEQIEAKIQLYQTNGIRIRTVYNPFYEVSNNLMSLWFAHHEMTGDFLVTNGDNLFAPEVFRRLIAENGDGITLAVSRKDRFGYDDMKVSLDDGLVARVSKQIEPDAIDAESPGLALVRGQRACTVFCSQLEALARRREFMSGFWLEVFGQLFHCGVPVRPWYFDGATLWQEVDFHADVEKLRGSLTTNVQRLFQGNEAAV